MVTVTFTGVQGVDEDMLKKASPFFLVSTQTTAAQYAGSGSCWHEVSIKWCKQTALTITESVIASPELLSSLERSIERLEPGKLLTDKDVFGDEDDVGVE